MTIAAVKDSIRTIPDYPKAGIMFRDITTLMADAKAFRAAIDALTERVKGEGHQVIAGIEARGFIFGATLAERLGLGFIPVRKKNKLPGKTIAMDYVLEYGTDTIEIHDDAVAAGQKVLVVDDLIATGGTAEAAVKLLEKAGAKVDACAFVIDLPDLGGADKLRKMGKLVHTLVAFEGD